MSSHHNTDSKVSKKNIFESRKGLTATFHPLLGSVFMYGGVGRHPITYVENFSEDRIEFTMVKDQKQKLPLHRNSIKTALKKGTNTTGGAN